MTYYGFSPSLLLASSLLTRAFENRVHVDKIYVDNVAHNITTSIDRKWQIIRCSSSTTSRQRRCCLQIVANEVQLDGRRALIVRLCYPVVCRRWGFLARNAN